MLSLHSRKHHPLHRAFREEHNYPPTYLIVAGVVVVGLGLLAFSSMGADLRRYLKIHSM